MIDTPRTELGRLIRHHRTAKGWTQQETADAIGDGTTTRFVVSQAETTSDPASIWPGLLDKLAAVLDIDRDLLYARAGKIPPEITDKLRGNVAHLKTVRRCLNLED